MIRLVHRFVLASLALCSGCAGTPAAVGPATHTAVVVPGVFGDGPWYDGLRDAAARPGTRVVTLDWGLPKPLFVGNFSSEGVHDAAEAKLATFIDATQGDIDLIGHSAGCGVVLGALAQCHRPVGRVVLIAPSVSPGYDLSAALARVDRVDVFYSDRDTFFLKWRCGTFGTYDRVKTPAAGFGGFAADDSKVVQHAYAPAWHALGNDGGHSGGTAAAFAREVIRPLLTWHSAE